MLEAILIISKFMRKPPEIIKGEKSLRLNLYLIIASYLLLVILIEPAIDFFLLSFFDAKNIGYIEQINKKHWTFRVSLPYYVGGIC